jgi:hypothetical protein
MYVQYVIRGEKRGTKCFSKKETSIKMVSLTKHLFQRLRVIRGTSEERESIHRS